MIIKILILGGTDDKITFPSPLCFCPHMFPLFSLVFACLILQSVAGDEHSRGERWSCDPGSSPNYINQIT